MSQSDGQEQLYEHRLLWYAHCKFYIVLALREGNYVLKILKQCPKQWIDYLVYIAYKWQP